MACHVRVLLVERCSLGSLIFFLVRLGSALHCRWASKYQGEAPPCGASCNWKVTILERGCFLMPELCESFSYFRMIWPSWPSVVSGSPIKITTSKNSFFLRWLLATGLSLIKATCFLPLFLVGVVLMWVVGRAMIVLGFVCVFVF